jgi:hypothetical protein
MGFVGKLKQHKGVSVQVSGIAFVLTSVRGVCRWNKEHLEKRSDVD